MSFLTIFLTKLLGLHRVILAIAMITRKQSAVSTIGALIANPPLLLFVEVISLACGLAMILGHYEQLFYFYMGGTLVLGSYLTIAGFSG